MHWELFDTEKSKSEKDKNPFWFISGIRIKRSSNLNNFTIKLLNNSEEFFKFAKKRTCNRFSACAVFKIQLDYKK
jgi:hypothetical protein